MENIIYESVPVNHNPFTGPEILYTVPTTEPQKEIWISCIMNGDDASRSYNESVIINMVGICCRFSMATALKQLVSRHESLRASFSTDGQNMFVYRDYPINLVYEDISNLNEEQQQAYLSAYANRDGNTAFDLSKGPLLRPALLKLSEQIHQLHLTAHHIVCDGWSMGVIIQDLGNLYSAYVRNEIPVMSPAPTFSSYAVGQLNHSLTAEYKATEKYWVDQFVSLPPTLNLPLDFDRPLHRNFKSHRDDFLLDNPLVEAVKKLGAKSGCSLVMTMLAGFELMLHQITGQNDITVGLPAAGQSVTGNENLLGHCANLLPLRSFPSDELNFSDYLKSRQKAILNAYDHQQFTFGSLLKKLPITRDTSRVPLVPVVFNFDRSTNNGVSFHGLKHKVINNPRSFETFEIFVNIISSEDGLILQWSYNNSLFTAPTIRKFMSRYETILRSIVANPLLRIGDLAARFNLNTRFEYPGNQSASEYPRKATLVDLVNKQAASTPGATAISFNGSVYSYQQVQVMSDQFAAQLNAAGTTSGDVIGLMVERSPLVLIAMLAIMKTGAAYVPVDPEYPKDRIRYMLEDSSAKFLLTSQKYAGSNNLTLTELLIEDLLKNMDELSSSYSPKGITENDLAYILYTSGSTGKPKGVRIMHYNLVNMLFSFRQILGIKSSDRMLAITTVCFDISGMEFYLPLISGASVDIIGSEVVRDGFALLEKIRMAKPTIMQATPATWQMLLEAGWQKTEIIPTICSGGEPLPLDLSRELLSRSKSLYNLYGPTETTIWSSAKLIQASDILITIGKPIANTRFYILNADGTPVAENETGEMYIAGDGVGAGYHNQPELTSQRFLPDLFSDSQGAIMYRTGDLGKFLPGGDIQCLGRIDQQIKIRGYRIEPGEIEYCLSRHAAVTKSVVISREDQPGNKKLVAYVVLTKPVKEDVNRLIGQWKQAIKDFLPPYMCPNDFVIIDELPLTPNGKIDRKCLPKPSGAKEMFAKNHVQVSRFEATLIVIWSKILGINNPGRNDDFFELGGHSLIAIRMMSMLEKETGIQLPVSVLFDCPTIASLASRLESRQPAKQFESLVSMKKGDGKMPLYMVHGARGTVPIFNRTIEHLHPDQPIYGLQARGLDGNAPIVETIEELASNYISEILVNNPDGPYALAGYSFGGLVAFEMARQLKAMNKEVKALIIFDTYADAANAKHSRTVARFHRTRIALMRGAYDIRSFFKNPIAKIRYEQEELKTKLHKPYRRIKGWVEGKEKDLFYYKYKIEETNLKAKSKYLLHEYDGIVELFRATERTYYHDDHLFLGWKPYAKGGVRVHEIPGEHNKIFLPPNVNELARKLQLCLDKAAQKETQEIPLFYRKRMMEAV
ncbi:non-ribosomal peptide synthetase [Flavitalea sp.]|nr:amino acid adenylation domain-containing protein [Flavitalea sp.]